MSKIFDNNISALRIKNPNLASKLEKHILTDVPQLVQENGAYNLVYKGKHIHNRQNPLAEANEIFSMCGNVPVSIHVVYGLGLGYLFQLTSQKSVGTVILYEPDLNILRIVFELVDFSADILKKNIYVADNFDELSQVIYTKSGMENSPELLSLVSQREFNPEEFDALVKKLQDTVGSYLLDLKYTKQKFYTLLKFLIINYPHLVKEIPLIYCKDAYKGKTALIVSAGPTLDRNIETIKKYRDRFVLFTVGTALKTLDANGIKPDFLCIIETYNSSRQVAGVDLSEVNFITEPYSNPRMRVHRYKKTYSHISANTPVNHLWAEICGENIEEYWSKGTVSYTAINCARILGCSKIILVGQDLAYIGGQCYSKDSVYKDLSCEYNPDKNKWEIMAKDFEKFAALISPSADKKVQSETAKRRLERLNNALYYVKGIQGDMLPTESVYASFVAPLSEFAQHFNDRKYINTSLVGAQIDGFENMSLEDALKDSEPVGDLSLNTDFAFDKEFIRNNFIKKLQELKTAQPLIEEGKRLIKSLKNDLKRYRNAGSEVLKTLKKLSVNYLALSSDFSNKSQMFDFMMTADKIDMDYEMKMLKSFTFESVSRICEKLSEYYEHAESRVKEVEGLINESIIAKS